MNEQAAEVLKHIANKLDVPVQQLWAGMVAYAPFWFYKYVACIVVGILAGSVLLVVCRKLYGKNIMDGMPCVAAGFAGFAFVAFSLIFGASNFGFAMAAKYAPESWATMNLMQAVLDRR